MQMITKTSPKSLSGKEMTEFKNPISKLPHFKKNYRDKDTTTTVRAIRVEDIPPVVRMAYSIWTKEYPIGNENLTHTKVKDNIYSVLGRSNPIILVAEQNEMVIGFVWGYDLYKDKYPQLNNHLTNGKYKHVGYINEIAVDPNFRGLGIAGKLLDCYEQVSKRKGVDDLVLDTINPIALRLYKREHYIPIIDPISKQKLFDKVKMGNFLFLHKKMD